MDKAKCYSWIGGHTRVCCESAPSAHGPGISAAVFTGLPSHEHSGHSYLGFAVLIVIGYALFAGNRRRRLYPWLAALLFFALMRLGATLMINGQVYDELRLPGFYLTAWFPWLFKAFWDVEHYMIGLLFPSAVLFAYGLDRLSGRLAPRWRPIAIVALLLLCVYERYVTPLPGRTIPQTRLDFIDWLAQEPNQDDIHIINLPMGRKPSKVYGYHQTFSGYPQAEGLASRTPQAAYGYIADNFLLRTWQGSGPARCLPSMNGDFQRDLRQLLTDQFTHIVVHHDMDDLEALTRTFDHVLAAYSDDHVTVYRLDDLRATCQSTALLNPSPQRYLGELLDSGLALPDRSLAVLSVHSFDMSSGKMLEYYSAVNHASSGVLSLRVDDLSPRDTPLAIAPDVDPAAALAASQIVFLAHDPRQDGRQTLPSEYRTRIESRTLESCGRAGRAATTLLLELLHLPPKFPCDLVVTDDVRVDYESDHQLGNLISQQSADALDLYFRWDRIPWRKHSISVQFFNADNEKAYNQDFVIRRESLAHHRIDLAALAPGEYQARMIVYDFETLASVPGEVISGDAAFRASARYWSADDRDSGGRAPSPVLAPAAARALLRPGCRIAPAGSCHARRSPQDAIARRSARDAPALPALR